MGLAAVLLLLALVFGGVGLLVAGLGWALVVAMVLLVASAVSSWYGYHRRGAGL